MAQRAAEDIRSGLLAKGFREKKGGDHHRLVYYDGERQTPIRTKISHGNKDYGDNLLKLVQKQVCLPKKSDLLNLVDCPMDERTYRAVLVRQGVL